MGGDTVHNVVEEQKVCCINKQSRSPDVCEGAVFNYHTVACQLDSSTWNLLQDVNVNKCLKPPVILLKLLTFTSTFLISVIFDRGKFSKQFSAAKVSLFKFSILKFSRVPELEADE